VTAVSEPGGMSKLGYIGVIFADDGVWSLLLLSPASVTTVVACHGSGRWQVRHSTKQ